MIHHEYCIIKHCGLFTLSAKTKERFTRQTLSQIVGQLASVGAAASMASPASRVKLNDECKILGQQVAIGDYADSGDEDDAEYQQKR